MSPRERARESFMDLINFEASILRSRTMMMSPANHSAGGDFGWAFGQENKMRRIKSKKRKPPQRPKRPPPSYGKMTSVPFQALKSGSGLSKSRFCKVKKPLEAYQSEYKWRGVGVGSVLLSVEQAEVLPSLRITFTQKTQQNPGRQDS